MSTPLNPLNGLVTYLQVKFTSMHDIPFLTYSCGHGAIESLEKMNSGIQIRMTEMKSVSIAPDGKSAIIGGGILSKDLVDTLWAKNKQTGMISLIRRRHGLTETQSLGVANV